MWKLSTKYLDFAFKHRYTLHSFNVIYPNRSLENVKHISIINCTKKYSTQSGSEPKQTVTTRIYDAPLSKKVWRTKMFSFVTSLASLSVFPKIAEKVQEAPEKAGLYFTVLSIASTFTVGTPIALHWLAKKYVLHIDYNPKEDNYTLYTYSFFLKLKPFTFKAVDVALAETPFTSVSIRGRGFLMEPSNFSELDHYKRMMGYDNEPNFQLEDKNQLYGTEPLERPKIPKVVEAEDPSEDSLPVNMRKKKR